MRKINFGGGFLFCWCDFSLRVLFCNFNEYPQSGILECHWSNFSWPGILYPCRSFSRIRRGIIREILTFLKYSWSQRSVKSEDFRGGGDNSLTC
jgi:hypothetical protein